MNTRDSDRRGPAWRPLLLGVVLGVLASVVGGLTVVAPFVVAKRQDLPLERAYGDFAVSVASRIGGGNQQAPPNATQRVVLQGRESYIGSCAECHGDKGDGRGAFGANTYPPATDLTGHDTGEKSDAQLFWIIKNGLSFTAMPGYGGEYSDQDIWALVAYVRSLQPNAPPAAAAAPSPAPGNPAAPAAQNDQGGARSGGQNSGQRGGGPGGVQLSALIAPTPTHDQLAKAVPGSADPVERGAAIYFAHACQDCHGAGGDAPANLSLPRGGGPELTTVIRQGRQGMPAYSTTQITDAELTDLQAYLGTIGTQRGGEGGGRGGNGPGGQGGEGAGGQRPRD